MRPKQVLSVEQMKHLQELGLDTSDASMVLIATDDDSCSLDWETALTAISAHLYEVSFELFDADSSYYNHSYRKDCGVFTLQDILDKLPPIIDEVYWLTLEVMDRRKNEWKINYARINAEHECASFSSEKLIDAAYEMLCWCIKKGFVKVNKEVKE